MKKTLVAMASVAALGAMSTAAMAQSSMTIYGNLDQDVYQSSQNGESVTTSGSNNHSSSFWGITSTEDMGGGMKASFDLRSEITLLSGQAASNSTSVVNNVTPTGGAVGTATAAGTSTPTTAGLLNQAAAKPAFFNRNAYLQLEGSWGAVRVGRQENVWWTGQNTVNTSEMASFGFGNLTSMQTNSVNVVSAVTGSALTNAATVGKLTSTNAINSGGYNPTSLTNFMGGTGATAATTNPAYYGEATAFMGGLSYRTPTISGFHGEYQIGIPKTAYTIAGNVNNTQNINASWDGYNLHLNAGTSILNDANGANQFQNTTIGAVYTMGAWKFTVAQNKLKFGGLALTSAPAGIPVDNTTAQGLGIDYKFSAAWDVAFAYGTLTDDANSQNKFTQTGVTTHYKLSPRTTVYAGLGNGKNSGTMVQTPIYAGSGGDATGQTTTAFMAGVRHAF